MSATSDSFAFYSAHLGERVMLGSANGETPATLTAVESGDEGATSFILTIVVPTGGPTEQGLYPLSVGEVEPSEVFLVPGEPAGGASAAGASADGTTFYATFAGAPELARSRHQSGEQTA